MASYDDDGVLVCRVSMSHTHTQPHTCTQNHIYTHTHTHTPTQTHTPSHTHTQPAQMCCKVLNEHPFSVYIGKGKELKLQEPLSLPHCLRIYHTAHAHTHIITPTHTQTHTIAPLPQNVCFFVPLMSIFKIQNWYRNNNYLNVIDV